MMKRLVVLQEEALIFSELQRPRDVTPPSVPPAPAPAAAVSERAPVPEVHRNAAHGHAAYGHAAHASAGNGSDVDGEDEYRSSDGLDLPALARAAAQRAERKAIDETLARFHWNRRKAATYLGVSYKTLLNKMKECGISDREPAH
jgi:DNA-binding NtrC family response regulator